MEIIGGKREIDQKSIFSFSYIVLKLFIFSRMYHWRDLTHEGQLYVFSSFRCYTVEGVCNVLISYHIIILQDIYRDTVAEY